jgi:phage terminase small subunit
MTKPLTIKQEAFCQAYILHGDKSRAYREAFKCDNMKPETVNRSAFELYHNPNITARIDQLKKEIEERNKINIDELISELANMVRFDPAEMYEEDGSLKMIHDMPKPVRQMISSLDIDELMVDKQKIGYTKKVRFIPKLDAIEKLMKHLGGYEKDNQQKKQEPTIIQWNGKQIKI